MKILCKRTLAIILTLIMAFASVGTAFAALIEDVPDGSVKFYVPECIYLYPGDAESTTRWCQYFLNNTDGSGNYSYARGAETSGKFYFHCDNATNISVTASGNSLTFGNFTFTNAGDTLNNSSFSLTAKNTNSVIEWKVDYTCKDGATRTAYAYTYIYRQMSSPTGTGFEAYGENKNKCYIGGVQLLWGANSSGTGSYGCDPRFLINGSGLFATNNCQPINSGSDGNGKMLRSDLAPSYFSYNTSSNTTKNSSNWAPRAYYYIDGSRFTNTNQLPHFRFGLTMSDDEKTEYSTFGLWLKNSSGGVITTYKNYDYNDRYVNTETVIANYAGNGKWGSVIRPNIAASSISATGTNYYFHSYWLGCGESGHGDAYANAYSDFTVYNNNKQALRDYYFDCINSSYTMQQERYTAASWATYMTALKNAGTTLGNPAVSAATVATAKTNLETARSGLQVETYTAKARHVALNHTGTNSLAVTDLVTDASTEETLTYTGGNTLTAKNNAFAGYTLVGYKANWDDATGTAYTAELTGITKTSDAVITNYKSNSEKLYTFYYTPNLYTVTLSDNVATTAGTDKVYISYGDAFYKDTSYAQKMSNSANGISVPSRTGYIFEGFYSGDTQMINSAGYITENADAAAYTADTTWTAKWTPINYTVRYNGNGATSGDITTSEHTYDEPKALTENGFARTGFNFAGWSYSANGTVNFANGASVTNLTDIANKTVDLFAVWNINTYTVAYDGNNATSGHTDPTVCTYNTDAAAAASGFERTGYTFAGWSTTPDGKVIYKAGDAMRNLTDENYGTVTLYAIWTPIKYKITFKNYDGTELSIQMVDYDSVPVYSGKTPEKPQDTQYVYTFSGWTPELSKVTGEAEYTAVFTESGRPYLVRFFLDDTKTSYTDQYVPYGTVPVYEGETPTKASTAQYNYVFDGWTPALTAVTGTATYTATFKATTRQYTVKFLNGDGTVLLEKQVDYGTTPSFDGEFPTKEKDVQYEYIFSKWDKNLSPVISDVVYTPVFAATLRSYTVSFKNHDGTLLKDYSVKYGSVPVYDGETPLKDSTVEEQFAFAGWDRTLAECTGDTEYTAQFTASPRMYKITFVNDDGAVVKETEFGYGSTPSCDVIPAKAADNHYVYTFKDWGEITAVTGEATYTAQYTLTLAKHIITFVNDNGDVLQATEFEWGEVPVYSGETPTKERTAQYTYAFKSWDKELTTVTQPSTYTAVYDATVNAYTVKFLNYDGSLLKEYTVDYGETPAYDGETPVRPANAQYTYTFSDWGDIASVTGDAEYTANYSAVVNKYTVKFMSEDGTQTYDEQVLEYGATPVYAGETPTKERTAQYTYTFKGWDSEIAAVTGDITYAARFDSTVNKYTITFKNEDGTVLEEQVLEYGTLPVYGGETPAKEPTAKYSYVHIGWDNVIAEVTEDAVYTAEFSEVINSYKIIFVNDDGTVLQDKEFEYDTTPTYDGEEPTKAATAQYTYRFTGWQPAIDTVKGEAVYTAEYTATINTYRVIFKDFDGTVLQETVQEYGSMPRYIGATPTRDADGDNIYTFAGWNEEFAMITGETVFNAKYVTRENKFTIKFVDDNGNTLIAKDYMLGEMPCFDGAPVKASDANHHYVFKGWDKDLVPVTGFTAYTAVFGAEEHELTLVSETAPTCTEGGKKTYTCSDCGYTTVSESSATGHDFGSAVIEGDTAYKECKTCGTRINVSVDDAEKEQNLCKWCGKYHYKYIRPDFGRISCIISQLLSFFAKLFSR